MVERPLLAVRDLSVAYGGGAPALEPLSFTLAAGECLAVLGANGAGKSSLLRGLMGLTPAAGEILLDDTDIAALATAERARRGIAFVPEGRRIFAGMTVRENLEVAAHASVGERQRRRTDAYALFPQLAARDGDAAWQLSGGQQQMLAIARAMMARPQLLLMDEPSLGLAPVVAGDVVRAMQTIVGRGTAIILAEQNAGLALAIADRALLLERGHLAFAGAAEAARQRPELRALGAGTNAVNLKTSPTGI